MFLHSVLFSLPTKPNTIKIVANSLEIATVEDLRNEKIDEKTIATFENG